MSNRNFLQIDMDNQEIIVNTGSVSGDKRVSNKRSRSSSSSSTSSTSSSSSSSNNKRKRSRRNRRKKSKRDQQFEKMDKLIKEVGELRKYIFPSNNVEVNSCNNSICSEVSGDLYDNHNVTDERFIESEYGRTNKSSNEITFDIETKLKEPSVPKTSEKFLKMLSDVQRLGSSSWSEIRYAETQKLYNHRPGFIDLDTNEEVKLYDTMRYLKYADKSYAAITYCILKQKESLQESIRNLLSWANSNDVNFDNLSCKVDELFLKGDLNKISSDLLQLVCGHRAESIEMRRESITSQVKDPSLKALLNKIPPSNSYIFDSEQFTTALEKAGGIRKAFWPIKSSDGFSQMKSNRFNRRSSRGHGLRYSVPSSGTHILHESDITTHNGFGDIQNHTGNNAPSRGALFNYHSRGQNSTFNNDHRSALDRQRESFHNRGSRPERGYNRGRTVTSRGSKRHQRYRQ